MTLATLNYLDASIESSLRRTGKLLLRRDLDGSDSGFEGVTFEKREVELHDGRAAGCSLARHGFEVRVHPLADPAFDFLKDEPVVTAYYADCAALIREATGAAQVYAFDHNVRSAAGKASKERIDGGQEVQGPARVVHGDYTLTSAPDRLRQLARPPGSNDTYAPLLAPGETLIPEADAEHAIAEGRYAFINVWRNIDDAPVESDPLVLCAADSVEPPDLAVFELHYSDRIGENYWSKWAPRHAWYTYPGLERDEALLIKQWDSAGPLARSEGAKGDAEAPDEPCTFSFHTAYFDPETMATARPRWSIEVRCIAIY
ncbi:MAG: CmcJ/NvfI family oxidoreductase [Myxococcota bacterium]